MIGELWQRSFVATFGGPFWVLLASFEGCVGASWGHLGQSWPILAQLGLIFFKHSNFQSFKLSNFQSLPLYVSNFQFFKLSNFQSLPLYVSNFQSFKLSNFQTFGILNLGEQQKPPRWPEESVKSSKMAPRSSKMVPTCPDGGSNKVPIEPTMAPKGPQDHPRGPKTLPREPTLAPKRPPIYCYDRKVPAPLWS